MGNPIKHFMWGFQQHFRIAMQVRAEGALHALAPRLAPEVFMVGIKISETASGFPACVEPETGHWIESEAFDEVLEAAFPIRETFPEAGMLFSDQDSENHFQDHLLRRAVRDAILQTVDGHKSKPGDREFFCSVPQPVDGYLVCAVLSVTRSELDNYPRLTKEFVPVHECRRMVVSRSLIDATIAELFAEVETNLLLPDPGRDFRGRDEGETLRGAARRLMSETAFRVDPKSLEAVHGLFSALCTMSTSRYERGDASGCLILARDEHPAVHPRIHFAFPVQMRRARRARKLLELTTKGHALHTNGELLYGLVDLPAQIGTDEEDAFVIRFHGHHHWELEHAGQTMMVVQSERPALPVRAGRAQKLRHDLPRLFSGIVPEAVDHCVALARSAEESGHGALIVVSRNAQAEAERLSGQATRIEPSELDELLLGALTTVDGAVLLDLEAHCHAFGVILDGRASEHGDPARGSRFNSALRYVESVEKNSAVAIVVSDDGGLDLIPDLRPRVPRKHLDELLAELDQAVSSTPLEYGRFNRVYDALEHLNFYLLAEDCERMNHARQEMDARREREETDVVRIVRQDVRPDPRMDPERYYE